MMDFVTFDFVCPVFEFGGSYEKIMGVRNQISKSNYHFLIWPRSGWHGLEAGVVVIGKTAKDSVTDDVCILIVICWESQLDFICKNNSAVGWWIAVEAEGGDNEALAIGHPSRSFSYSIVQQGLIDGVLSGMNNQHRQDH